MHVRKRSSLLACEVVMAAMLSCCLGGCVHYVAKPAATTRRGDLTVRTLEARVTSRANEPLQLDLQIDAVPDGVRLKAATLVEAGGPPCTGHPAVALGRTGDRPPGALLRTGELLRLEFPRAAAAVFAQRDARIGLYLMTASGESRCVTIRVWGPEQRPAFETRNRFTLGLDMGMDGLLARLGPIDRTIFVSPLIGIWLGGLHVAAGVGVAGVGCPDDTCPTNDDMVYITYDDTLLLRAAITQPLWARGDWGMGLSLRYQSMNLRAKTFDGTVRDRADIVQVAPYFGAGVADPAGRDHARLALTAVEIPVGFAVTREGHRSATLGINLRMQATFF